MRRAGRRRRGVANSVWLTTIFRMRHIRLLLVPIIALGLVGAAKKEPAVTVRFHTEGNARDGEVFTKAFTLGTPPREVFLAQVPNIAEKDITAIYPFPASDGTMGCAFRLDPHGRLSLDALSVEKRGGSLVAFVNGQPVSDILIDRRVSDGVVTIPRGLSKEIIGLLSKKFRVLTPEKPKP